MKRKVVSLLTCATLALSFTVGAEAAGFSSTSRSSTSSFKSPSSSSSYKSSSSSSKSSTTSKSSSKPKVKLDKSNKTKKTYKVKKKADKPKKKVKVSVPAFTPPTKQIEGYKFDGKDIFLTAAGTYVVYSTVSGLADCDYDDIMEGDDDCKEVTLTNEQLQDAGLKEDEDKGSFWSALADVFKSVFKEDN
jgi:hypothetical protein